MRGIKMSDRDLIDNIRKSITVEHTASINEEEKSESQEVENEDEENNSESEESSNDSNASTEDNNEQSEDDLNGESKNEESEEENQVKFKKDKDRFQRRINKEVAARKAAEAEAAELKRILEAKDNDSDVKLTAEDVHREAKRIAAEEAALKEFNETCDKLSKEANQKDTEFDSKVKEMAELIGPIPGEMIGVLGDLDKGGEVLAYLVDNLEEMEKLYTYSPNKMAVYLTKLSFKLNEDSKTPKPTPKPVSKLPKPNTPITGNGGVKSNVITGKESMDDFVRIREAQVAERRKARGY